MHWGNEDSHSVVQPPPGFSVQTAHPVGNSALPRALFLLAYCFVVPAVGHG